ncbi:Sucrose nonfermenting 4-like protein [Vitis vinifera]|uniref:Sucrose nonfermenting 4-like protein n=1 Tax=Vitis vinifera TaxID=29760 RepID=A0A438KCG4_VITVI|nr:Sucrose nonfermenting 4-like protein [Vitis vinifera]
MSQDPTKTKSRHLSFNILAFLSTEITQEKDPDPTSVFKQFLPQLLHCWTMREMMATLSVQAHYSKGFVVTLLVHLSKLSEVSSIPIVDDNDSLLDIYSRSDITALAKDRAYAQIHLDNMSIHQALQLGQDANSPYGFISGQRCQMWVRRLVIVEAGSKRVEGVISLSDVFRFLLG